MRSFLPRLTNGLTYCGGISRTRWPSASARRPQWCEPPHASSTTSVGASPARNASKRPRRSSRRSTGRSPASTPCSVKTCFDVSMARRLSSITDGPSGLRLDNPNHGTQRCPAAVHPNGQMDRALATAGGGVARLGGVFGVVECLDKWVGGRSGWRVRRGRNFGRMGWLRPGKARADGQAGLRASGGFRRLGVFGQIGWASAVVRARRDVASRPRRWSRVARRLG